MTGTITTLDAVLKPTPAKLNDFDIGSILSTAAGILPDGVQAAGQGIIDSALGPVKELAKSISPELYKTLDKAAQQQIDSARQAAGLPPVNPEAAVPSKGSSASAVSAGTDRSATAASSATPPSKTFVSRLVNPYGYGGAAVGLVGGWYWTGRGDLKKSTGKRIGVTLLIGVATGIASGLTSSALSK